MYFVYVLECKDKTLYVGTAKDVQKRLLAHNTGKQGAKYTRGRRPVVLKYSEKLKTVGDALRREIEIKKWPRKKKLEFLAKNKKRPSK